jgi:predicted RNA-binding protein associated with RNAse of E/G family
LIPRPITIQYRRLPDRVSLFRQHLVYESPEYLVTFLEGADLTRPVRVGEQVILDPGAPVVWFTYPDRWYDVGRFHRRDGTFTGFYANLLLPVTFRGDDWHVTDLCLDVWSGADGIVALLDEDDFESAAGVGWIDPATAETARREAGRLVDQARLGRWPSAEVLRWNLDLATARLAGP